MAAVDFAQGDGAGVKGGHPAHVVQGLPVVACSVQKLDGQATRQLHGGAAVQPEGPAQGVGPLGKAYYQSAHSVLDEAKKIEKKNYSKIEIEFDYDQTSNVHHFLSRHDVLDIVNSFEKLPVITCYIKQGELNTLKNELQEVSKGSININELEFDVFL